MYAIPKLSYIEKNQLVFKTLIKAKQLDKFISTIKPSKLLQLPTYLLK